MKAGNLVRVSCLAFALLAASLSCGAGIPEAAHIDSGALSGIAGHHSGVTEFLGIPFAAPPIGALRWKAPVRPSRWTGTLKADHFNARCAQRPSALTGQGHFETRQEYVSTLDPSEDCLYLNVWTPAHSASEKLPVMVWFYGGGFEVGGADNPMYRADDLAAKGIVVVTVNYRLGILGFLSLPELDKESSHGVSGNYGTLDQIESLKWIKRNVAAFGGDRSRVTVFGQSAGGGSVHFLTLSPLAKGLFHRGIAESATGYYRDPYVLGQSPSAYRLLGPAEAANQKYLTAAGTNLGKLRQLSTAEILALPPAPFPPAFFSPVVDGWVIAKGYGDSYNSHAQNDVPMMVGGTADEDGAVHTLTLAVADYRKWARDKFGTMSDEFLSLYPASTDVDAPQARNQAMRDYARTSRFLWAELYHKASPNNVYIYYWNHGWPGSVNESRGAFHVSEVPYVMSSLWVSVLPFTDGDRAIADMMSSYWANFARDGNPNGKGLPQWPPFSADSKLEMQLGADTKTIAIAPDRSFDFFRRYFENFEHLEIPYHQEYKDYGSPR